jgi:hypothetical protein
MEAAVAKTTSCEDSNDLILPKALMMLVEQYLNNYELCKLFQSCTYLSDCVQAHYRSQYQLLTKEVIADEMGKLEKHSSVVESTVMS